MCIVGAGPAGISLAGALARRGRSVCLIESGGSSPTSRSQALARGRSVGAPYPALAAVRSRAFGGTSHRWNLSTGWLARPLDPSDFDERAHVPWTGWPLRFEDLAAQYRQAAAVCGLPTDEFGTQAWASRSPHDPLALAASSATTSVFQYGHRGFADRRPELERFGDLVTVLRATAVELLNHARGSKVDGVTAVGDTGPVTVQAETVVLAAGGIENARLLLLAAARTPGSPLANAWALGRFFMERISLPTGLFVPSNPAVLGDLGFYRRHEVDGTTIRGTLQLPPAVRHAEGLLNCAVFLDRTVSEAWAAPDVRFVAEDANIHARVPLPPRVDDARRLVRGGVVGEHDLTEVLVAAQCSGDPVQLLGEAGRPVVGGQADGQSRTMHETSPCRLLNAGQSSQRRGPPGNYGEPSIRTTE